MQIVEVPMVKDRREIIHARLLSHVKTTNLFLIVDSLVVYLSWTRGMFVCNQWTMYVAPLLNVFPHLFVQRDMSTFAQVIIRVRILLNAMQVMNRVQQISVPMLFLTLKIEMGIPVISFVEIRPMVVV
jgi:hypothetical protein